jgi:hypothetical protein
MKFGFKLSISFFLLLIFTKFSFGQKQSITGKVIDDAGKPVAYASITFKGSNKGGTWTMEDGSFRTYIPKGVDTIICTHLNYNRSSKEIDGNDIINFVVDKKIPSQTTLNVVGTHKFTPEELSANKNKRDEITEADDRIFTKVEINASFIGGEKAFQKYLATTIIYPDTATISTVKGIVEVSFIVGKDGLSKSVTLLKGVNKFADNLVLQAISKMPKWTPALQNGRYVEQYKEVSVSFDITGIE